MAEPRLYKYSGAGNDFIVLDGRHEDVSRYRQIPVIRSLCSRSSGFKAADGRVGSDGLMILSDSAGCDFRMEFYNPDGSSGMMCGNGGRCIAAFADHLGIRPSEGDALRFEAPDGLHEARILSREGNRLSVRLKMIDVESWLAMLGGFFLNTGTRHFVIFNSDVESVDIEEVGPMFRNHPLFQPEGTNVNFVQLCGDGSIKVRTFEKGVEAETLACGTGIVASALATVFVRPEAPAGACEVAVRARRDDLAVSFEPVLTPVGISGFRNVMLTGPAELID